MFSKVLRVGARIDVDREFSKVLRVRGLVDGNRLFSKVLRVRARLDGNRVFSKVPRVFHRIDLTFSPSSILTYLCIYPPRLPAFFFRFTGR